MGLECDWNEIPKILVFLVKDSIKLFQLEMLGDRKDLILGRNNMVSSILVVLDSFCQKESSLCFQATYGLHQSWQQGPVG